MHGAFESTEQRFLSPNRISAITHSVLFNSVATRMKKTLLTEHDCEKSDDKTLLPVRLMLCTLVPASNCLQSKQCLLKQSVS